MRYLRQHTRLRLSKPPTWNDAISSFPTIRARRSCPSRSRDAHAPHAACPSAGKPERQTRVGDTWTLSGGVVVHYRDYILRADKVVYHQSTTELEADGHLQVEGGPEDVVINASNGDMRLNLHTARFFNVDRLAGSAPKRAHRRLLHAQSISLLRPGAAADRRRQLSHHRRHHDQLPPAPSGLAVDRARHQGRQWRALPPPTPFSRCSASRSSICPICAIRWRKRPRERAAHPHHQQLVDQGIHRRRAGLRGAQPQHGHGRSARNTTPSAALRPMATSATRAAASTSSPRAGMPCWTVALRPPHRLHGRVNQGGIDVVVLGRQDFTPEHPHRRQRRIPFQLRLQAGLQRQLLAGRQFRGAKHPFASRTPTTGSSPRHTWAACRPLPVPLRATRRESSICPACASMRSISPLGATPLYWGLGFVDRPSQPRRVRIQCAQRGPHRHLSRTSHCPSSAAAGAWSPRWLCATPPIPAARRPI